MKEKILSFIDEKDSYTRNDLVDEILSIYYDIYGENIEQDDKARELVEYIRLLAPDGYNKKGSIEGRIKWLKKLELFHVSGGLERNHQEVICIYNALNKFFCDNNVKFYHASGFMAYILTCNQLERFHHDIDLMMSEEEYLKLCCVVDNKMFRICEHWGQRNDGATRRIVHMFYKEYKIPISIVLYEINDQGMVINDYIVVDGELFVDKVLSKKENVDLCLTKEPFVSEGINCYSLTLEAIYSSKLSNRIKDAYDREKMRPYVDEVKLKKIIDTSDTITWREKVIEESMVKRLNSIGSE